MGRDNILGPDLQSTCTEYVDTSSITASTYLRLFLFPRALLALCAGVLTPDDEEAA